MTFDKLTGYCNTVGFCESFHYLEDNKYLFFHYRQNRHVYTVFYSKKTGQLINAKSFLNDMDKITAFYPVLLKDNRIYCLLKAEDINTAKSFLTENNLLPAEILDTVEEFDNPVIVVFTLKDF
jgi:hypothetical protein